MMNNEGLEKLKIDFANKDTMAILYNNSVSNLNKVYLIGKILAEQNKINKELWYAILDLKDEHFKEIIQPDDINT